jgi:hypothetical protein
MGSTEPGKQFSSRSKDASESGSRGWNFIPNGAILLWFYLLFAALLVTRRPDCIRNPQFWAEEGKRFFVDAREHSIWINLATYSYGYFDLLVRLIHQAAALVRLEYAPLVLVLSALAIQATIPTFVISARCANWMGIFPIRLAAALLYCGLPNSFETHCIALHARVHLAVLAALVIVSTPSLSRFGKSFDAAVVTLAAFSGPFVLLLAPTALWWQWRARTSAARRNCLILVIGFIFAIFAIIGSGSQRLGIPLGASLRDGIRIVGGQFTLGFLLGERLYASILCQGWFDVAAATSFLGLALIILLILAYGKTESRYLLFIGLGSLAIALAAPIGAAPGMTSWRTLWRIPGNGQRYYLVPMAMLLFALSALVGHGKTHASRWMAATLFLILGVTGVRNDWKLPAFTDFQFRKQVALYRSLPPGSCMTVPINPPGWHMEIRKPAQQKDTR